MSEFINYLDAQVDKAIYVWGAQGKNLSELSVGEAEKWIRDRETNSRNALRAIDLFRKRIAAGVDPILAFDCSGLIMHFLHDLKKVCSDMTAQRIYERCDYHPSVNELRKGDLVFRGNSATSISHVGAYVGNGKTIECKGRDDGVVKRDLSAGGWNFYGHLALLDPYLVEPKHPQFMQVTSPMSKGEDYKAMQIALNKAGFTDYSDETLSEDGKWGKKSKSAFEKMITFYGGNT